MNLNQLRKSIDYKEIYSAFAIGNKLLETVEINSYFPCRKESYFYGKIKGKEFKATINSVDGVEFRLEINRKTLKDLSALDYIFSSSSEEFQRENIKGYVQVSAEEGFIKEFEHCVQIKFIKVLARQFEKLMNVKNVDRKVDVQNIEYYTWDTQTGGNNRQYAIKVPRHLTECFFVEKNKDGEIKYTTEEENETSRKELLTTFRNRVRKAHPEANEFTLENLSDSEKSRVIGDAIKNAYRKTQKYQLEIAFDSTKKE